MSNIFYDDKKVEEIDKYYGIDLAVGRTNNSRDWIEKECLFIQSAFKKNGINLTLAECRNLYSIHSDHYFCAGWSGSALDGGTDDEAKDRLFNSLFSFYETLLMDRLKRLTTLMEEAAKHPKSELKFILDEIN